MKRLITLLTVLFISNAAKAQWWPSPAFADSCDFENNIDWVYFDANDTTQLWQIGKVNKPFFGTALLDSTAIVTDTLHPYAINQNDYFELHLPQKHIDSLPMNYGNIYYNNALSFWHKYLTDSLHDGGYVMVSVDSGATWNSALNNYYLVYDPITNDNNDIIVSTYNFYQEDDTLNNGIPAFQGLTNEWKRSLIYFEWTFPRRNNNSHGMWGFHPNIWVRFYFYSDSTANNLDGWLIDRITLVDPYLTGAVNTLQADKVFNLSPNPVQEALQVQLKTTTPEQVSYSIINLQGQVLHHDNLNATQSTIDVHNLPQGMYLLQLQGDTWLSTRKFIKIE